MLGLLGHSGDQRTLQVAEQAGGPEGDRASVTGHGTSGGGRALEKCLFPREKSELCRGAVAHGCSHWSGRDAMPGAVAAVRRWERESPAQRPLAPDTRIPDWRPPRAASGCGSPPPCAGQAESRPWMRPTQVSAPARRRGQRSRHTELRPKPLARPNPQPPPVQVHAGLLPATASLTFVRVINRRNPTKCLRKT